MDSLTTIQPTLQPNVIHEMRQENDTNVAVDSSERGLQPILAETTVGENYENLSKSAS
jgi:hypothetical protein